MTRPRRLYSTTEGKFYYLVGGKKKFIKAPTGISQKQISKINIKNIVNIPEPKRIKRRKKRVVPVYGNRVGVVLQKSVSAGVPSLPITFFYPKKNIPTLDDQAKLSSDTTTKQLTNLIESENKFQKQLLQGISAVPSSSRIPPIIASESKSDEEIPSSSRIPPIIASESKGDEEIPSSNIRRTRGPLITPSPSITGPLITPSPSITREASESSIGSSSSATSFGKRLVSVVKKIVAGATVIPEVEEEDERVDGKRVDGKIVDGKRVGGKGDGLYNDEIEKIVKKRIKNYIPVIASDEIDGLLKYVGRGDKRFGFVINTNPSTSDGSGNDGNRLGHWRSIFINNEDDYPSIEYFDPLAEGKMPPELISICRKITRKMNPEFLFKYKQNMLRRQSKLTSNCGHHSIKFLDDRFNGIPFSEASGYDTYMERMNSVVNDSVSGEKDIMKAMKKYESYI